MQKSTKSIFIFND